ncbi:MAG: cupredoxin domain-containing protein [Vicinamibacterales bacterium]
MSGPDVAVLLAALGAIGLVNWYFLFSRATAATAATAAGGVQALTVQVHGGYAPALIEVERDRPVRLTFDRQEDSSCSEEVVLGDFGIRRYLPAFQQTVVEFTPHDAGDHEFTCGMGMLRGTIRVR